MLLRSRARPVRTTDNLAAICEPIVYQCEIFNNKNDTNDQVKKDEIGRAWSTMRTKLMHIAFTASTKEATRKIKM
jgi:hypothetical protein